MFQRARQSQIGRTWRIAVPAAVLSLALIIGLTVWLTRSPAKPTYDPPTRARQYIAFTACLLTGPAGLADSAAKSVWSGMETASTVTKAQVTYLSASSGQSETVGSVTPFANTLIQQHCNLILAVGPVEVTVVQSVAKANASEHFVLIGGGTASGNVTVLPAAGISSIPSRVASVVEDAVGGVFHPGVVS